MWIGSQHPVEPYITISQLVTFFFYFAWFLIIVPVIGLIIKTLADLATIKQ